MHVLPRFNQTQPHTHTHIHHQNTTHAQVLQRIPSALRHILLLPACSRPAWAEGSDGGAAQTCEVEFEGTKSARQAVSVSHLIAAAARENDGMQQHTHVRLWDRGLPSRASGRGSFSFSFSTQRTPSTA